MAATAWCSSPPRNARPVGDSGSGPRDDEPYAAERPRLPASLAEALDALEASALFRTQFGELFIDYYLRLKRNELGRYLEWKSQQGATGDDPTAWEQNEYFDFF